MFLKTLTSLQWPLCLDREDPSPFHCIFHIFQRNKFLAKKRQDLKYKHFRKVFNTFSWKKQNFNIFRVYITENHFFIKIFNIFDKYSILMEFITRLIFLIVGWLSDFIVLQATTGRKSNFFTMLLKFKISCLFFLIVGW